MGGRSTSETVRAADVFINCPFDETFEGLFLAYVAGIAGLGLTPRCVLEIPSGARNRLDRLFQLISACGSSVHDLSHVRLDRQRPRVPRFNMPFELGLAAGLPLAGRAHRWFIFEARSHRIQKSLSDVNGFDPYIHDGKPAGVLRELPNAFRSGRRRRPSARALFEVYGGLRRAVPAIKREHGTRTLFAAQPFAELVVTAQKIARRLGLFACG